jgi:hypothetical protein
MIRRIFIASGFWVIAVDVRKEAENDSHQERVIFVFGSFTPLDEVHSLARVSTPDFGGLRLE